MRLLPGIEQLPWICSFRDVNWLRHRFDGAKLGHLLMQQGLFAPTAHDAIADVEALLALLNSELPTRETVLAEALRTAQGAGLPITIHAGEGFGASSIRQAIEDGGAGRIGHGTRLLEDESLLAQVRDAGIPLEICITSNVQTGVAATHAEHPVRHYYDEGLSVCLCTDNRLMSGVTLTEEYEHARDDLGFTWLELLRIARMAFEASYAAPEVKQKRLDDFDRDVVGL